MSVRKETSMFTTTSPFISTTRGATTLVVDATKKSQAQSIKALSGSNKARQKSKDESSDFETWVVQVVDAGSGDILVQTSKGEHRLTVQDITANRDVDSHGPDMHPDVSKAVGLAKARGIETAARILDQDNMLSGEAIGERMGMSRQAVDKARKTGKLLAIEGSKRGFRYPDWQLDQRGFRRSGLIEVLDLVGDGWDAYRFFMATDNNVLNRDLLARGKVEEVLRKAQVWASGNYALMCRATT
jgi:hypothetical protein